MESIHKLIEIFKLSVLNIESVPESFSSEVYKLTLNNLDNVYVKIPYNRDKLVREFEMLERLKGVIPVPKVLDFWDGDNRSVGALLLSAIDGVPCTSNIDQSLAFQIGNYHAMLHEVTMPAYGCYGSDGFQMVENNSWRLYLKNNFEKWKEPCKELLHPDLFEKCITHFDRVYSALPEPDGPCVVHMDFRPGNILIKDNKVVGIIDYESARGGSTEIDFTKINRYVWEVNPLTRLPYVQGYESVRPLLDLEAIIPFYSFYDAFSAVVWCKTRGIENNKAFLQESIEVLQRSIEGMN
ncbi:aminoglycoside 3'-phosphotransferase/choline kinase family protein [Paenibacillus sp. FSL E2-8871]|uniref:phosphotransferase family protein n=1 Tax=Paenibacillus sp. FSL E2-8871 TaxID=2975326 RepID=UPI0030FA2BED